MKKIRHFFSSSYKFLKGPKHNHGIRRTSTKPLFSSSASPNKRFRRASNQDSAENKSDQEENSYASAKSSSSDANIKEKDNLEYERKRISNYCPSAACVNRSSTKTNEYLCDHCELEPRRIIKKNEPAIVHVLSKSPASPYIINIPRNCRPVLRQSSLKKYSKESIDSERRSPKQEKGTKRVQFGGKNLKENNKDLQVHDAVSPKENELKTRNKPFSKNQNIDEEAERIRTFLDEPSIKTYCSVCKSFTVSTSSDKTNKNNKAISPNLDKCQPRDDCISLSNSSGKDDASLSASSSAENDTSQIKENNSSDLDGDSLSNNDYFYRADDNTFILSSPKSSELDTFENKKQHEVERKSKRTKQEKALKSESEESLKVSNQVPLETATVKIKEEQPKHKQNDNFQTKDCYPDFAEESLSNIEDFSREDEKTFIISAPKSSNLDPSRKRKTQKVQGGSTDSKSAGAKQEQISKKVSLEGKWQSKESKDLEVNNVVLYEKCLIKSKEKLLTNKQNTINNPKETKWTSSHKVVRKSKLEDKDPKEEYKVVKSDNNLEAPDNKLVATEEKPLSKKTNINKEYKERRHNSPDESSVESDCSIFHSITEETTISDQFKTYTQYKTHSLDNGKQLSKDDNDTYISSLSSVKNETEILSNKEKIFTSKPCQIAGAAPGDKKKDRVRLSTNIKTLKDSEKRYKKPSLDSTKRYRENKKMDLNPKRYIKIEPQISTVPSDSSSATSTYLSNIDTSSEGLFNALPSLPKSKSIPRSDSKIFAVSSESAIFTSIKSLTDTYTSSEDPSKKIPAKDVPNTLLTLPSKEAESVKLLNSDTKTTSVSLDSSSFTSIQSLADTDTSSGNPVQHISTKDLFNTLPTLASNEAGSMLFSIPEFDTESSTDTTDHRSSRTIKLEYRDSEPKINDQALFISRKEDSSTESVHRAHVVEDSGSKFTRIYYPSVRSAEFDPEMLNMKTGQKDLMMNALTDRKNVSQVPESNTKQERKTVSQRFGDILWDEDQLQEGALHVITAVNAFQNAEYLSKMHKKGDTAWKDYNQKIFSSTKKEGKGAFSRNHRLSDTNSRKKTKTIKKPYFTKSKTNEDVEFDDSKVESIKKHESSLINDGAKLYSDTFQSNQFNHFVTKKSFDTPETEMPTKSATKCLQTCSNKEVGNIMKRQNHVQGKIFAEMSTISDSVKHILETADNVQEQKHCAELSLDEPFPLAKISGKSMTYKIELRDRKINILYKNCITELDEQIKSGTGQLSETHCNAIAACRTDRDVRNEKEEECMDQLKKLDTESCISNNSPVQNVEKKESKHDDWIRQNESEYLDFVQKNISSTGDLNEMIGCNEVNQYDKIHSKNCQDISKISKSVKDAKTQKCGYNNIQNEDPIAEIGESFKKSDWANKHEDGTPASKEVNDGNLLKFLNEQMKTDSKFSNNSKVEFEQKEKLTNKISSETQQVVNIISIKASTYTKPNGIDLPDPECIDKDMLVNEILDNNKKIIGTPSPSEHKSKNEVDSSPISTKHSSIITPSTSFIYPRPKTTFYSRLPEPSTRQSDSSRWKNKQTESRMFNNDFSRQRTSEKANKFQQNKSPVQSSDSFTSDGVASEKAVIYLSATKNKAVDYQIKEIASVSTFEGQENFHDKLMTLSSDNEEDVTLHNCLSDSSQKIHQSKHDFVPDFIEHNEFKKYNKTSISDSEKYLISHSCEGDSSQVSNQIKQNKLFFERPSMFNIEQKECDDPESLYYLRFEPNGAVFEVIKEDIIKSEKPSKMLLQENLENKYNTVLDGPKTEKLPISNDKFLNVWEDSFENEVPRFSIMNSSLMTDESIALPFSGYENDLITKCKMTLKKAKDLRSASSNENAKLFDSKNSERFFPRRSDTNFVPTNSTPYSRQSV